MRLYKKGLNTGEKSGWEELPLPMRKQLPVPKDPPLISHGCLSDTVFAGCAECPVRKCAKAKPGIRNCAECWKYPCMRFGLLKLIGQIFGFEKKLPHWKTASSNMKTICEHGVDYWPERQRQYWTCPKCGKGLSWYLKDTHTR